MLKSSLIIFESIFSYTDSVIYSVVLVDLESNHACD